MRPFFPPSQWIGLSSFYYLPRLYQKMRIESSQRLYLIQYFLLPMTELLLQNEWLLTLGEIEPQKLLVLLGQSCLGLEDQRRKLLKVSGSEP